MDDGDKYNRGGILGTSQPVRSSIQDGEFVLSSAAASKSGQAFLDALNAQTIAETEADDDGAQ